jgi:hypothetical protein
VERKTLRSTERSGGLRADAGDVAARQPAGERKAQHHRPEQPGIDAVSGGKAGDQRAAEDGDEGRALDPGIGARQFLAFEMIGQDAVFDRAEQGGDDAEEEERRHQHRDRVEGEADDGDTRRRQLHPFQPLGHDGLVELVGKLAAEGGEQEERRHEDGAGERHQRSRLLRRDRGEDQEDQRVLQEIVVEGGKELGPEEWREAPGRHEILLHGASPILRDCLKARPCRLVERQGRFRSDVFALDAEQQLLRLGVVDAA